MHGCVMLKNAAKLIFFIIRHSHINEDQTNRIMYICLKGGGGGGDYYHRADYPNMFTYRSLNRKYFYIVCHFVNKIPLADQLNYGNFYTEMVYNTYYTLLVRSYNVIFLVLLGSVINFKFAIMVAGFRSRSTQHDMFYENRIKCSTLHVYGETDQVIPKGKMKFNNILFQLLEILIKSCIRVNMRGYYLPMISQLLWLELCLKRTKEVWPSSTRLTKDSV